jgi:hypothetical protein
MAGMCLIQCAICPDGLIHMASSGLVWAEKLDDDVVCAFIFCGFLWFLWYLPARTQLMTRKGHVGEDPM